MSSYELKPGCSKVWAIHFSKTKKKNYYYNRETRESYWEKPPGIREDDIIVLEDVAKVVHHSTDEPGDNKTDVLTAAISKYKKDTAKSKPEQDSGVVDLFNDLVTDNEEMSFVKKTSEDQTRTVKSNCAVYIPGGSRNDIVIKCPYVVPHRKKNRKSKRRKDDQVRDEKMYNSFLAADHKRRRNKYNEKAEAQESESIFLPKLENMPNLKSSNAVKPNQCLREIKRKESFERIHGSITLRSEGYCLRGRPGNQKNSVGGLDLPKGFTKQRSSTPIKSFDSNRDSGGNNLDSSLASLSPLQSYSSDEEKLPPVTNICSSNLNQSNCKNSRPVNPDNIVDSFIINSKTNNRKKLKTNNSPLPSLLKLPKENKLMEVEMPSPPPLVSYPDSPTYEPQLNSLLVSKPQPTDCEVYEEMDWEEVPPAVTEKVVNDVADFRKAANVLDLDTHQNDVVFMEIGEDMPTLPSSVDTFMVLDTNVFICNLRLVMKMAKGTLRDKSDVVIVVPWQVMQELDKLKVRVTIGRACSAAINFICTSLLDKPPRIVAQSPRQHFLKTDSMKHFEVPDDAILNCCLQLIDQNKKTVLCTNDKNLVSKACACEITVVTASMLAESLSGQIKQDIVERIQPIEHIPFKNLNTVINYMDTINKNTFNKSDNSNMQRTSIDNMFNSEVRNGENTVANSRGNISFMNCYKSLLSHREVPKLGSGCNSSFPNSNRLEHKYVSNNLKDFIHEECKKLPTEDDMMSICPDVVENDNTRSSRVSLESSASSSSSKSHVRAKLTKCEVSLPNSKPSVRSDKLPSHAAPFSSLNFKQTSAPAPLKSQNSVLQGLISKSNQSEDLMMKFQECTNKFLLNVLSKGMHSTFGDLWSKRMAVKPPWGISDLYYCVMTHWMSIVDSFLSLPLKEVLVQLRDHFRRKDVVRYTANDLKEIIDLSYNLCSGLEQRFPNFVKEYRDSLASISRSLSDEPIKNAILSRQSPILLTSDVTLSTIDNARKRIEFFCLTLSKALGTKDVCDESSDSNTGGDSLVVLVEKLPGVNLFLNEFVGSSKRLLKADPTTLKVVDVDIEKLFSSLTGLLTVIDPDFSMDHVLQFVQHCREDFEEIVSEFEKLKYNLAQFTFVIGERKRSSLNSGS